MVARVFERGQRAQYVVEQREHPWAATKVFTHGVTQWIGVAHQHVNHTLQTLFAHAGGYGPLVAEGGLLCRQQGGRWRSGGGHGVVAPFVS